MQATLRTVPSIRHCTTTSPTGYDRCRILGFHKRKSSTSWAAGLTMITEVVPSRGGKGLRPYPGSGSADDPSNIQEDYGDVPGSLLHREEMWRTLEWVDRQRANPMARLRGERVRMRSADNGLSGQNSEKTKIRSRARRKLREVGLFSFSAARSASTIMAINSWNRTRGCQPSSFFALLAPPMRRSTSVGR